MNRDYKNELQRIAVALEKLVHCQNTPQSIKSYNYEKKTNTED